MLRLTIGLGGSYLNEEGFIDHQDYSVDYYGFSLASAFDIGGAPIENLVLHARVAALDLRKPNVTEDSDDLDFGKPSVNAGLFAPAITYYLMPTNVYLTGAIGLTVVSFFDDNINEGSSTDLGVGVNLDVGKEWWVGNDWGLGVTGRVWYSHNTDGDEETEPFAAVDNLVSFTILLSATYQ